MNPSWEQPAVRLWRGLKEGTLPRDLLLCGAAGSGKTYGLLSFLHVLARDNPRLRILIARATRASLTESVLVTYEQEILPLDGMEWIAAEVQRDYRRRYRYPSGSEIIVGGLDNPQRILSTAWDIVYINEAIEATRDAWEMIVSRMNRPGRSRRFALLVGDTNPGDPSHWLKQRCDTGLTTLWDVPHEANPAMFDGRAWTPAGLDYLAVLDTLTGTAKRRLRHGLWAAGAGAWFGETFDLARHVSDTAVYRPHAGPLTLAVDTGVHVGACWWQAQETPSGPRVAVLADYYRHGAAAYDAAVEIRDRGRSLGLVKFDLGLADPSGGAASGLGTTHLGEFARAGLNLRGWLKFPGCVNSGLGLLESLLGGNPPALVIHPRCTHLIAALTNYMRAKRNGQYIDEPVDPQHPYEELVDALRSSLLDHWPEGRRPPAKLGRVHARSVF